MKLKRKPSTAAGFFTAGLDSGVPTLETNNKKFKDLTKSSIKKSVFQQRYQAPKKASESRPLFPMRSLETRTKTKSNKLAVKEKAVSRGVMRTKQTSTKTNTNFPKKELRSTSEQLSTLAKKLRAGNLGKENSDSRNQFAFLMQRSLLETKKSNNCFERERHKPLVNVSSLANYSCPSQTGSWRTVGAPRPVFNILKPSQRGAKQSSSSENNFNINQSCEIRFTKPIAPFEKTRERPKKTKKVWKY